jgi:predicted RNA methylase
MLTEIFIIISIVTMSFLIISFWPVFTGANWEPTSMNRVKRMLEMADVSKKDYVYDIGFGDGRIIFSALEMGAKAGGVEIEPVKFLAVKIYSKIKKFSPELKLGSAYNADFTKATVITTFMSAAVNNVLKEKYSKLKKGTKIVSYYWKIPEWTPVKVDKQLKIYMYEIGKSNI